MLALWFRPIEAVPGDDALHAALLAYVSDYHLLAAALVRHKVAPGRSGIVLASLDHAMWFHRPVSLDDWLLYVTDSPSASGSRGLARGSIFDRSGELIASTAQEGLMRVRT
jgi:acyl-CoA thioesterase-2